MFMTSGNGEIRTTLDERRSSPSRALHRRAEHLAPKDKPRYARDLRRQGWSYRHIADVLKEPYRRIAQWLAGEPERPRTPLREPTLGSETSVSVSKTPVSVAETLKALAAPPPAEAPQPEKVRRPANTPPLATPPPPAPQLGNGRRNDDRLPSQRPPADQDLEAVTRMLDTLSTRVDDLVAAIAADRKSQRKERADRRARDAKLLALIEELAAKLDEKA